ncbi:serine/threonine protein kinase [Spongiactinospora rosea]|uniref:non-specific serine/threonine protein kinase n=2 Tax=Spongiactinospora rosea TaxID=2248750 RepID=A0A366LW77_9ACTN|nr:serine/threonine protein kinase [Spongiactinospora rosea]
MGEVWRATDALLGRTVAVKVLLPALMEDPGFEARFLAEARAMATLHHPGVVDVYDYGSCALPDGSQVSYLVMEHVDGESLDRVLRRGALPPATAMRVVAEAGDALSAAHEQGIVHRDVKPGNLLVRADGRLALTDFGIARSAAGNQLTSTGMVLGSVGYCAPEQATGGEITPAADIYALGVVGYQCLTGRMPFEGETPVQILVKHLNVEPPALPAEIPAAQRHVVTRALSKEPADRWPSAAAMAAAARRAADDPTAVPPLRPVPAAREANTVPALPAAPGGGRRRKRAMTMFASAAAAVVATLTLGTMVWMQQTTGSTEPVESQVREVVPSATVADEPSDHPRRPAERRSREVKETWPAATPTPWPTNEEEPTGEPTAEPTEDPTQEPTEEPTQEPTDDPPPTTGDPEPQPSTLPTSEEPPPDQPVPPQQCIRAPCP